MTTPFLGSKISLISKSKIRYEGILYTIDPKESTIALAKVRSFGTEDRKTDKPVPGKDEIYEYIIFRASDIEDLVVDMPTASPSNPGLSDPAIIQAQSMSQTSNSQTFDTSNIGSLNASVNSTLQTMSGNRAAAAPTVEQNMSDLNSQLNAFESVTNNTTGGPSNTPPFSSINYTSGGSTPTPQPQRRSPFQEENKRNQGQHQGPQRSKPSGNFQQPNRQYRDQRSHNQQQQHQYRPSGMTQTRRPMPQQQQQQQHRILPMHYSQQQPNFRGRQMPIPQRRPPMMHRPPQSYNYNRTNNGPRTKKEALKIDGDFDFEKANQEFQEIESKLSKVKIEDEVKIEKEAAPTEEKPAENETKHDDEENVFYDKQKSFFDKISCEALERSKGKINRVDWKKERELNSETFGNVPRRPPFRPRGGYNNNSNYTGFSRQTHYGYRNGPSGGQVGGAGDSRRANGPSMRSTRYSN